jgi:hypothetical protein
MKAGDLVKITRRAIGVPPGTIGLILKTNIGVEMHSMKVHSVEMYMPAAQAVKTRIWLEKDLELINESR